MSADADGDTGSNGTARGFSGDSHALQRAFQGPATNGARKVSNSSVNGSSVQNGKRQSGQVATETSYFGHDREEVTRLLIQALSDMGYHSAAQSVSRDSGFELESPTVAAFRSAVLQGSWEEAEHYLFGDSDAPDSHRDTFGHGLVLTEGSNENAMRFCIRQQKYLELLEVRDFRQALSVLRNELTPLNQEGPKLHFLSSLLMCQNAEDVKAKAEWDGAHGESRFHLLSDLSSRSPRCTAIL